MRNGFPLNIKKSKTIKPNSNYQNKEFSEFLINIKIQDKINTKFLGVGTDNNMNWQMHIKLILPN
jgi:hypothetical protein